MSKESRRTNRERLRQERIKQKKRAKRNRLLATIGAAVAVIALVVGGGYLIVQASNGTSAEEYTGTLAPKPSKRTAASSWHSTVSPHPSSRSTPTTSAPTAPGSK